MLKSKTSKDVLLSWPVLYKTGSNGAELQWSISVSRDPAGCTIDVSYGQVDGAMQHSSVTVSKGKNIGRANETTAMEQADSEAAAKWTKQLDKGYSETRGGASKVHKPMLAESYDKHKHKVDFTKWTFVQPKLDGVRAIAVRTGKAITLTSRNGKEHKGLQHIRRRLLELMDDGEAWDGELYVHGIPFQTVISLVKKDQKESLQVQYHVYDAVVPGQPFKTRFYDHREATTDGEVQFVSTVRAESHEDIQLLHSSYVELGYEGVMLRHGNCDYRSGARSDELLKVKSFLDGEFKVLDVIPGIGKMENQGIFVCETAQGAAFKAKARGMDSLREEYLSNKNKYIGEFLTVRYFSWTDSEVKLPRFPVGIGFREDL